MTPLQIQKLILFLLQRSTRVFTMNIAGLFVGSLEGAAKVKIFAHTFKIMYFKQEKQK